MARPDSDASTYAFFGEICYTGDPFKTLVRENRNGATRTVERGDGWIAPYIGYPAGKK